MKREYAGIDFTDSDGTAYTLKLSTNQFIEAQKAVENLRGREYQRYIFWLCLIHGSETQKTMTLERAGELLDDITFAKASELTEQTRFFANVKQSNAADEARRDAELRKAGKAEAAPAAAGVH